MNRVCAFAVGTLGGEEGVCVERIQCGGLAHAYARGTVCGEGCGWVWAIISLDG